MSRKHREGGRARGPGVAESGTPELSVVMATYNRLPLLLRLLEQLGRQSLAPSRFEVVVVDDGSRERVVPALQARAWPFHLEVVEQENAGPAAARQAGVQRARAELLVIVDDDMQVAEDFLAQHLALHPEGSRNVALGLIRPDENLGRMPLFERYHSRMLEMFVSDVREGRLVPRGDHLYTGNVSLRREDFLAAGGFDRSLKRSEDVELGIRLEKLGCRIVFSELPYVIHGSDHTKLDTWLKRALHYGVFDLRIARKHPDVQNASPWRFLGMVNPLSRPLLGLALVAPRISQGLAAVAIRTGLAVDRLGQERLAIAAATLVYGMEYYRGVREETGGAWPALKEYLGYLARWGGEGGGAALAELVHGIEADHAAIRTAEAKYHGELVPPGRLPVDAVQKVGFQILIQYRVMRFFRRVGLTFAAKASSRLIRHLYGSDIHWDADIAPGCIVVHGMGMAINGAARIGPGAVLSQQVTVGESRDPVTGAIGSPVLEAHVHVGPGARLLGPITVGEGSKIMANAVVLQSVPAGSIVETPASAVRPRKRGQSSTGPGAAKPSGT
ncbi:glycosyltransferase [Aggregicoccus sp. 17bor-14]|uniref:exopolysaccharide biosynthesis glycosyltransferase EpsD n=1 Tax=Myxococcaceae TaxID=31 RepID=UPI00129CA2AC|nr:MULTISPECIES: exopolysaccharide biosynthesis glycosyltransferase EpsD [Myxococcaceae]MBF5042609.1 glycosyltransferase [Simulacricoccus sp. 17bor-14]MRI88377.1 glycosyltransferase [Aggregicoccus sp. 17bor-14]